MTNPPLKYYQDVKVYFLKSVINLPLILWNKGREEGFTDLAFSPNLSDATLAEQLIERKILTLEGLNLLILFQRALSEGWEHGQEYWIQLTILQKNKIENCRQDILSHFGLAVPKTSYSYQELLDSPMSDETSPKRN